MIFKRDTKLYSYEIIREAGQDVMYVNYLGAPSVPDIASSSFTMARIIDYLIESPHISRIVLVQQRNYSYNINQVTMLMEIAQLLRKILDNQEQNMTF